MKFVTQIRLLLLIYLFSGGFLKIGMRTIYDMIDLDIIEYYYYYYFDLSIG